MTQIVKMHFAVGVLPCVFYLLSPVAGQEFNLTILHTNDVHARFEETNAFGGPCSKTNCFGGVARRYTAIQEIRQRHANVLLLDGGDQFQGTLWFSYYQGNATKYFMEQLGYDIMALGNHEFDLGITGLAKFLQGFSIPVVCSNLNSYGVASLQGLYTSSRVIKVNGRDVGVIGYVTKDTPELVLPDGIKGLQFEEVIRSVRREAEDLAARGYDIIIALGHAGFLVDLELAKEVPQLDLVIGGHSNTFLYTGDPPSNEKPVGPYPSIVVRGDESEVPVVQAFTAGKYLGYLNLTFDANGKVIRATGNPILLTSDVQKDPAILQKVMEWRGPLDQITQIVIGQTLVFVDGARETCRLKECNMGNMATDALVHYCLARLPASEGWARTAIAVLNSGGIRASFSKGDISMKDVTVAYPFRNTLEVVEVTGRTIWAMLENSVQNYSTDDAQGRFLQMSGVRVVYNIKKETGNRVVSVDVLCTSCEVPEYSPIKRDANYLVVTNNFMVQGGDGYSMIKKDMRQHLPLGNLLSDVVAEYTNSSSPLINGLEGRIKFVEEMQTKPPVPKHVCDNLGNSAHLNFLLMLVSVVISLSLKLS